MLLTALRAAADGHGVRQPGSTLILLNAREPRGATMLERSRPIDEHGREAIIEDATPYPLH